MEQALIDLRDNPERAGTKARHDLSADGLYSYHLQFSRSKTPGAKVRRPRHIILYLLKSSTITVVRILRDNCDLRRHLPQDGDFE